MLLMCLLTTDIDLGHVAEVRIIRFLHYGSSLSLSFLPPFPYAPFWKETLHTACTWESHSASSRAVYPHAFFEILLHGTFVSSSHFFPYSILSLYQYGFMSSYFRVWVITTLFFLFKLGALYAWLLWDNPVTGRVGQWWWDQGEA